MSLDATTYGARRTLELRVFLILSVMLAPALSVVAVGGYGLAVWTYQMIAGPPGSPAKAAPPLRAPAKPKSE